MDKLLSFQEKIITNFFSIVQGSAREKTQKLLSIRGNIYESAVSITSPLKTITDPVKEIKMVKTDFKKGSKPNFLFARSFRYNCPTFYEKKISHFTIPLTILYTMD